jgi:electron transfer flavoprotein alpha/beta subunit
MRRNDADALALALSLGPDHKVTALLAGPAGETGPLHRALTAGASRAVRLAGEEVALSDFHTMGQLLAGAIMRIGADLVVIGGRSDDEGVGAMSASLARHLACLHVSRVEAVAPADSDRAVEVTVRGGGWRRRLRLPLPAVLAVWDSPGEALEPSDITGDPTSIELLSLADPEATVVRRRTELLGRPELASRGTREVNSASELLDALTRR